VNPRTAHHAATQPVVPAQGAKAAGEVTFRIQPRRRAFIAGRKATLGRYSIRLAARSFDGFVAQRRPLRCDRCGRNGADAGQLRQLETWRRSARQETSKRV